MSPTEEQILLGSILGDGHLSKPRSLTANSYYVEAKKLKHENYLLWKKNNLPSLGIGKMGYLNIVDPRFKNPNYTLCRIHSKTSTTLTTYRRLFYIPTKKLVLSILYKLTPLAWAVWYCDDGHYNYSTRNITLCLQAFSKVEQWRIKDYFDSKSCPCGLHNNGNLVFTAKGTKSFLENIRPVFPDVECMQYKLGLDKAKQIEGSCRKKIKDKKSYEKRRLIILQQHRQYYLDRKAEILQKAKVCYQANKDRLSKVHKDYYLCNKPVLIQKNREYRQMRRKVMNYDQ